VGYLKSHSSLDYREAGKDGTQIAMSCMPEFPPSAVDGTLVKSKADLKLDDL